VGIAIIDQGHVPLDRSTKVEAFVGTALPTQQVMTAAVAAIVLKSFI